MIKAKDLQIDCLLINSLGHFGVVKSVKEDSFIVDVLDPSLGILDYAIGIVKRFVTCNDEDEIEQFYPIQITQKLLELLNFRTYRDEFIFPNNGAKSYNFRHSLYTSNVQNEWVLGYDHDDTGINVQYLHQLQIITPIFTKKILNINPLINKENGK